MGLSITLQFDHLSTSSFVEAARIPVVQHDVTNGAAGQSGILYPKATLSNHGKNAPRYPVSCGVAAPSGSKSPRAELARRLDELEKK
jgi:hypothetical protein